MVTSSDDRRSRFEYCVFVGGNLVPWKNKKNVMVAQSTSEAEYRTMTLILSEMMWLKGLLSELRVLRNETMIVHNDNIIAMKIVTSPIQLGHTKYTEIDRFFIKEKLDSGSLRLFHQVS